MHMNARFWQDERYCKNFEQRKHQIRDQFSGYFWAIVCSTTGVPRVIQDITTVHMARLVRTTACQQVAKWLSNRRENLAVSVSQQNGCFSVEAGYDISKQHQSAQCPKAPPTSFSWHDLVLTSHVSIHLQLNQLFFSLLEFILTCQTIKDAQTVLS